MSYFNPDRPTRLCIASRQGPGFVLQQRSGDTWTLVQARSHTESRYAVVELELLAVVWAIY